MAEKQKKLPRWFSPAFFKSGQGFGGGAPNSPLAAYFSLLPSFPMPR